MVLLLALDPPLHAQQSPSEDALAIARAGRSDSALALLARARASDPTNSDLQLAEARVMSWAGKRKEAIARFDSLLAANPANADAMVGLGYVYHWQGKDRAAHRQAEKALAQDSANADARELRRASRIGDRGALTTSAGWNNDSDRNTNFWQSLSLEIPLAEGIRFVAGGGVLEASDPVRDAVRYGGEAGLGWTSGTVDVSALAGGRRLDPELGASRTAGTYRGKVSWRPDPGLGIVAGYARYPYDDIASLFERNIDIEALEGGFDARASRGLLVSGGGGALWFSDGNRRLEGHAAITQAIGRYLSLGASGRALGYREAGTGYFSPNRFHLLEGTAGVHTAPGRWDGGVSGGLGGQQVGRGGDIQTEWHVEGRVGTNWGDGNRLEGFGGVTNSLVSSTTGAFRFRFAGVLLRLGL